MDFFPAAGPEPAPLHVFVHGGYGQETSPQRERGARTAGPPVLAAARGAYAVPA